MRSRVVAVSLLSLLLVAEHFQDIHSLSSTISSSSSKINTGPLMMKGYVNMAVSVDGMIAGKDNSLDWLNEQPVIEGEDYGFGDFLKSMDAMIMGRNTFETVAGFGKDMWAYGELPIVVWTRQPDQIVKPEWLPPSVTIESYPSPKALWDALTDKGYRSVYVDGGRTIEVFLEAGFIHYFKLSRIPIILGQGTPLFDGTGSILKSPRKLKHQSTKTYANGFVLSEYEVVYEQPNQETRIDESK